MVEKTLAPPFLTFGPKSTAPDWLDAYVKLIHAEFVTNKYELDVNAVFFVCKLFSTVSIIGQFT